MFIGRQIAAYALLEGCSMYDAAREIDSTQRSVFRGCTVRADTWKQRLSKGDEWKGTSMKKAMFASKTGGGIEKNALEDLLKLASGCGGVCVDLVRNRVKAAVSHI